MDHPSFSEVQVESGSFLFVSSPTAFLTNSHALPYPPPSVHLNLYLGAGTQGITVAETKSWRLGTCSGVSSGLLFKVCGR